MRLPIIVLSYTLLSESNALLFGVREPNRYNSNTNYSQYASNFLLSPEESIDPKQGIHCRKSLSIIAPINDTTSWLQFFLITALHITELYNLGMYQNFSDTEICIHGDKQIERVSFPSSSMLFHDQGILTLPHMDSSHHNQRVLHPFDDFINFARPDLATSLIPHRLSIDQHLVNVLFQKTPLQHFPSFSKEVRDRLLHPRHPIHLVMDLYEGLLFKNAPPDATTLSRIERQVRISNRSLSSPLPLPLPLKLSPSSAIKDIPPFPFTPRDRPFEKTISIPFSINLLSPPMESLATPLPSPVPYSSTDVSNPSTTPLPLETRPRIGQKPLFRTSHTSVHNAFKAIRFQKQVARPAVIITKDKALGAKKKPLKGSNPSQTLVSENVTQNGQRSPKSLRLRPHKKTKHLVFHHEEVKKRVRQRQILDVSDSYEYYSSHPFFSPYISHHAPSQKTTLSLSRFIKDVCREYKHVEAPLLDLVCKKQLSRDFKSLLFFSHAADSRPYVELIQSWFITFLSGKPHLLDYYPDAPSILKGQLHVLALLSQTTITENATARTNNAAHSSYSWIIKTRHAKLSASLSNNLLTRLVTDPEGSLEKGKNALQVEDDKDNRDLSAQALEAFTGCAKILSAFVHYFSYVTVVSSSSLPLPKMWSLLDTKVHLKSVLEKNTLLDNTHSIQPVFKLYNDDFLSSIGLSTSSRGFSIMCLLSQYRKQACRPLLKSFSFPSASSSPFVSMAKDLYSQAIALSQHSLSQGMENTALTSKVLSLYYWLSHQLLQLEKIQTLSNPPYFAFFMATVLFHLDVLIPSPALKLGVCGLEAHEYHLRLHKHIMEVYNMNLLQITQDMCEEFHSYYSEEEDFFKFVAHFAEQLRKVLLSANVSPLNFAADIFLPWGFEQFNLAKSIHVRDMKNQSPALFFLSPEGKALFQQFLHDAAVLETIKA